MRDRSRARLAVLSVVVVAVLSTLLARLSYLQLGQGQAYRAAAADNRIRSLITPAARGQVLDDRGVPLVRNRTALVVSVTRSTLLAQADDGVNVLNRLAKVLGMSSEQIALTIAPCGSTLKSGKKATRKSGCWNGSPQQAVPLKSFAAEDVRGVRSVLAVAEHAEDFPGVATSYAAVREYPGRSLASHVLGYLGPISEAENRTTKFKDSPPGALIGRAGVEDVYDQQLRGTDGIEELTVDKDGTVTGTRRQILPQAGENLVLSLDSAVQRVAEAALAQGMTKARTRFDKDRGKQFPANKGAAIVVDVRTGQIVAMASNPTFDPTAFVGGISTQAYRALSNDPTQPLLSNAVQGLYSPGSTFKIVSTAAAVAGGNPITGSYACPPALRVGNRLFRNFEGETFGTINFRTTLIKSCDTVYYGLAYNQWKSDGGVKNTPQAKEVFPKMARSWGFGGPTLVDLPDERNGLITDRKYKQRQWDQTKAVKCKRARTGYPEVARADPTRAAYLLALAREFCTDGYRYNAGDAALFAIGQGDVLVTPLQLAMAYAALANGGSLLEPRLAKGFLAANGSSYRVLPPSKAKRLPVDPAVLAYIRNALQGVPQPGGTAQTAFAGFPLSQVPIAGKTGTADVQGKAPTSWFASFAPANAPRYAIVVMVPEAGTGGTTAAPIARKIYDALYGLEGQKRLLNPTGALPTALPVIRPDGTVAPPGTKVPVPPRPEDVSGSSTPSTGSAPRPAEASSRPRRSRVGP
jgi:penicillin-binding protein 2